MFRSKKKKIRAGSRRVARTFDDEDENDANQTSTVGAEDKQRLDTIDEEQSALVIALQRRKAEKRNKKRAKSKRKLGSAAGPVVRSFDIEEADENDDEDQNAQKKKKKRKKKGLGFGGGHTMMDFDQDPRNEDEMGGFTTSTYGEKALEKLISEQKRQTVPPAPQQPTASPTKEPMNGDTIILNSYENIPEESYIPLENAEEEQSATNANKEQEKAAMFVVDDPPPDESHGWERQIEQRAGLRPSSQVSKKSNSTGKVLSLDELSEKLKSTVETIDRQREELENSTNRLRADREHAKSTSKDHLDNLKQVGLACEFYQSTRRDLTLWVGALRDLHDKVRPIATAFREMLEVQTKEFAHEFRIWQDDCVATLYQTKRLDRVLGRQPESTLLTTASNETVLDEFGRDVGSQYLRDRELRFKERVEYIHRKKQIDCNLLSCNDIIKREDHDEEDRSKLLQQALNAALEDLDQEYTSATRLKTIFDDWFAAYFDDYQQCFATLSFGDLYAVFIQVELCKSDFFPDILLSVNDRNDKEPPILELDGCLLHVSDEPDKEENHSKNKKTSRVAIENAARVTRAIEKGVLPMLTRILGDDADTFDLFFSTPKSSLMARLVKDAAIRPLQQGENCSGDSGHSSGSNTQQQLQKLISAAIKKSLEEISIPLLNKDNDKGGSQNDDDKSLDSKEALDCSIRFARLYQVQMLQQALCNMILHWFPLIDLDTTSSDSETGIHSVLNFINDKYLVLLSSMDTVNEEVSASSEATPPARDFFKQIWEALNSDTRKIVESPSLMLMTMPLRAAARAYQLD